MSKSNLTKTAARAALVLLSLSGATSAHAQTITYWRFEQTQALNGTLSPTVVGQSLTGQDATPVDPRPYGYDETGNKNGLQVWEPKDGTLPSPTVFSDNVPNAKAKGGVANTRSLWLRNRDYFLPGDKPLGSADLSKGWGVEASVMTNRLEESQVFLCKEHTTGTGGDLSVGYDAKTKQLYIEARGGDGQLHRASATIPVTAGVWYDLVASAAHDEPTRTSQMTLWAKRSSDAAFGDPIVVGFEGDALAKGVAMWAIGRGDAITQVVQDGGVDEIRISAGAIAAP